MTPTQAVLHDITTSWVTSGCPLRGELSYNNALTALKEVNAHSETVAMVERILADAERGVFTSPIVNAPPEIAWGEQPLAGASPGLADPVANATPDALDAKADPTLQGVTPRPTMANPDAERPEVLQDNAMELGVHTDEWMQGDRYATILERLESGEVFLVRLDLSGREVKVRASDVKRTFHR